jgi:hypothetical protein
LQQEQDRQKRRATQQQQCSLRRRPLGVLAEHLHGVALGEVDLGDALLDLLGDGADVRAGHAR